MLNFFKRFGLGILYVLLSPLILAFLLLWATFNLGIFFIELIKGLKSFFKGKPFFSEFEEDIEAKKILSIEAIDANVQPQNNYINPAYQTNAQINPANPTPIVTPPPINPNNNIAPTLERPTIDEEEKKQ